jgi:hypothetical protein
MTWPVGILPPALTQRAGAEQGANMKKLIVGAALGLLTVGAGSTAFAGEVGGNGHATPVARPEEGGRSVAGSICAFNGLDDGSESGDPVTPGVVQSFGFEVAQIVKTTGAGASPLTGLIRAEGPGTACRGFATQGG